VPDLRIAIVDDSAFYLDMLARTFRRDPRVAVVATVHADAGVDVVDELEAAASDVAVVDFHMPGLDGLALIAALQARGSTARTFLVTAMPSDQLNELAAARGVEAVLDKAHGRRAIADRVVAAGVSLRSSLA
jgi:two-component system response regulator DesR